MPSLSFSMISWPSAWVAANLGIAPLGPKQFLRKREGFGMKFLVLRVAWPRTAAAAPDAKSRTPAVGLANVPTIPLPIPVMKPWKREYLAITLYPIMGLLQLVTQMVQNKTAMLEWKKKTLGEDKQSKLVSKMSKFFVPLVPVGTGFLSRMAVLSQADDMLKDTWITCESALTDTPELWAPSIGCVTILVSPPTKPIPRPLTPATKWSLELPNLSALIASRLSWNFVSIDAFHRPSDNDPVI